jgi:pimeloyl-ACP methyl ester carboxylesterase
VILKGILYAGAAALLIYGVLCALLYLLQSRLLYLPTREVVLHGVRSIRLQREEVTLKIWELHPDAHSALIYFGGNAEDVSASIADFAAAFPDRAVYLVNYRGYGGSTGRPSEAALVCDATAIYDRVAAHHDRVAVVGRSLGSGVAVALATRRSVDRLVLITPYDSIDNVAADHFPFFPVRWLLRDHYDSLRRIGEVHAPVLALLAEHDAVVLPARSEALLAAKSPDLRHALLIHGATHDDISSFPEFWRSLRNFVQAE